MVEEFTKYERARIIGARGLQIAMDAPLLLKLSEEELNGVNFDPLKIAEKELDAGILPISIRRPLPVKQVELKLMEVNELNETFSDEEKEKEELEEEKEIEDDGEIMDLIDSPEEKDEEDNPLDEGKEELE